MITDLCLAFFGGNHRLERILLPGVLISIYGCYLLYGGIMNTISRNNYVEPKYCSRKVSVVFGVLLQTPLVASMYVIVNREQILGV